MTLSKLTAKEEALYKALHDLIDYGCNEYERYWKCDSCEKCAMCDTEKLLYRIMSRIRNAEEEQGGLTDGN